MSIIECGNGPCTTEIKNGFRGCANPVETWAGCVLRKGEHNWHDDSDFYALVWDESAGCVREIEYASTRGWTYHNGASVDASPETVAKASVWEAQRRAEVDAEIARIDAATPSVGKEVKSLTTRGKNKGVTGLVRRVFDGDYGRTVAVEVAGEDHFRYIAFDRVAVIERVAT